MEIGYGKGTDSAIKKRFGCLNGRKNFRIMAEGSC